MLTSTKSRLATYRRCHTQYTPPSHMGAGTPIKSSLERLHTPQKACQLTRSEDDDGDVDDLGGDVKYTPDYIVSQDGTSWNIVCWWENFKLFYATAITHIIPPVVLVSVLSLIVMLGSLGFLTTSMTMT
ncbi:hypothetical protein BASA60_006379 [Batrachochytrium salamandrivorans]|nr:hypothetical protein BASA60_006379 [Batrachochytrium salamandrivorans]